MCSEIAQKVHKPELLLLAGLFHDIAKGRGGDHAKLGSKDVNEFCRHHQLNPKDTDLVSNLVAKHLLMSHVAQKEDIDDSEVVDDFVDEVKSIEFLEFLYLLTVADIRATKSDLWNNWKDSLLKRLFYKAKKQLEGGKGKSPSMDQQIKAAKQMVIEGSITHGYQMSEVERILATLPKDYFLRYETNDILWHLYLVTKNANKDSVIASKLSEHNVVDIFVYSDDSKGLFFKIVSILERLGLNVVDARILTTKDKKAYNTISVLQDSALDGINISQEIEDELNNTDIDIKEVGDKFIHRHFDHKMKIDFSTNRKWNLTQLSVNVIDKQGILSNIAHIFYKLDIFLINARIATVGERVEDVFFISNNKNQPLSKKQKIELKEELEERL